jgi:putative nucleotidyltransferase with HDIG domain
MKGKADIRAYIRECFPEIEQVVSDDLREKTIDVFQMALERSTWKDLKQIPNLFVSQEPMGNYVSHNRTVAQLCRESARIIKSFGADIDEELILVGALLHDVGKIVEYGRKDGADVVNERIRHPLLGAHMALVCGMPDDVVHIIAVHAWEGEVKLPPGHTTMGSNVVNWRTKEAMVVSYCDLMAAKVLRREWHEERGTAPSLDRGVPFND